MLHKIFAVVLIYLPLFILPCRAQDNQDTILLAKQFSAQGQNDRALALLEQYYAHHPGDLNAIWLYAKTAYWESRPDLSEKLYQKAVTLHPDNYLLKLDYAKMLTEWGSLKRARTLLEQYLHHDPGNAEANMYLATVSYWEGRYEEARTLLREVLVKSPASASALALQKKINAETAPALTLGLKYNTDDQPLQVLTPLASLRAYSKRWQELSLSYADPVFINGNGTRMAAGLQAGDCYYFSRAGLRLSAEAGLFLFPGGKNALFTGLLKADQAIMPKLTFTLGAERFPYLLTRSSLDSMVVENKYSAVLSWNKPGKWNGKAGVEAGFFPEDDNSVTTAYGWLVSPSVCWGHFGFSIGYGYNFSTSKENRFVPKSGQGNGKGYKASVEGVYNPYFTPNDQQIHSVIGLLSFKPTVKLTLSLKFNYGFFAVSDYPFLYQDLSAEGDTVMLRGFDATRFTPYDFTGEVDYNFGKSTSLGATFEYHKTIYYTSQFAGLAVRRKL